MKRIKFIIMLLFIIFSNYAPAQQQDLWTTFTTKDGLTDNYILSIIETSDGALWFGTANGVSRFHDGSWTTFTKDNGLANNYVRSITETTDGSSWFGTVDGVSRFHDGSWTTFKTDNGLADNWVNSIIETSDGALWFGTANGVSRLHNNSWTTFTIDNGLANNSVSSIIETSDGALWFGTANGVSRLHNNSWTTFTIDNGLVDNDVLSITETSDGALWFGTSSGLCRLHDGSWTTFTMDFGMPYYNAMSITETSDGTLWLGTIFFGVSRLHGDNWKTFTTADGLADNNVFSIIEACDGALWFGTENGVSRFQDDIWTTFTTDDGLLGSFVGPIIEASNGALWFGTGLGVSRLHDSSWTSFEWYSHVWTIIEASDGALWFGTDNGGVSRFYNDSWTWFSVDNGLGDYDVRSIIEASDGALWFGTANGVSRLHDSSWTTFTADSGLGDNDVRSIIEASDGALWFGTYGGGVSRFHDNSWTTLTRDDGLVSNGVNSIIEASDRTLWFGTANGVSRFHDGNWTTFTMDNGLIHNWVSSIIEASDRALWFGTRDGVSRYHDGSWTTFTKDDGLVDNYVNAIIEASDGKLWFGTSLGVSRLKPDRIPPYTTTVDGVSNGDIINTSSPVFIVQGYDFRTKQENLMFSYTVIDTSIRFEEINNSQWSFPQKSSTILTSPLSNGTYRFYVRAIDRWSNIDPSPASITFSIDVVPPTVIINSPKSEDIVTGDVVINGFVFDVSPRDNFLKNYKLSYGSGEQFETVKEWSTDLFNGLQQNEVSDSTLAIWHTEDLPSGPYWLKLEAEDSLGNHNEDLVKVNVVKASKYVDARSGATFGTFSGNIEIYVPPNAIAKNMQINVCDFPDDSINFIQNETLHFTDFCFEITPENLILSKPATLIFNYPDSLTGVFNEQRFCLYHSPNGIDNWRRLGGLVNKQKNKITTTFKQSAVFALCEDLTVGTTSGIQNINCQPRIFSPQGDGYDDKTAISFDLGKESNVTIKIYNPAGRLVKVLTENETMSHGNNVVYWDGKNQQGEFCVSGLYIVTIQVEEQLATKTVVVLNK